MPIDFTGNAQKLKPGDVAVVAASIGLKEADLRAVIEVETDGSGFDTHGRPDILPERHIFWQQLSARTVGPKGKITFAATPARDRAAKAGLAYPKWGTKPYPHSSDGCYALLDQMIAIDEDAALKSCSWGLGQIMGGNFKEAGYSSASSMVTDFCDSEKAQLVAMATLIKGRGLDEALRTGNYDRFALSYNGQGYKKNDYAGKLATAHTKWLKRLASPKALPVEADDGSLRVGSAGPRVKALQEVLTAKGYPVGKADGDFGNLTRDAVNAWKSDNGLDPSADGTVSASQLAVMERSGPRPLSAARTEASSAEVSKDSGIATLTGLGAKAAAGTVAVVGASSGAQQSGILDQAQGVADKASQAKGIFETFQDVLQTFGVDVAGFVSAHGTLILLAAVAGLGVVCYRALRMRVNDHQTGKTL